MKLSQVDFKDTHQFSSLFLKYIQGAPELKNFYSHRPEIKSFKEQIELKQNFPIESRQVLSEVLETQYEGVPASSAVKENISLLKDEETFTVTTGHQLNIFTGPLYFIYKIVSVINACKELKKAYPKYNFVPVYWMASEDHDFDEISYFNLNGKKLQWHTSQTGAVGRFDPKELKEILEKIPGVPQFFKTAYLEYSSLADAVRHYINELFGSYGLVVVDGDDHHLKRLFEPVIEDDLFLHSSQNLVKAQSNALNDLGYKTQVFPRDINFFYMEEGVRNRIVRAGDLFQVLDTDISFDEPCMRTLIKEHPEKFSPNVILRPLYQEMILPNLAYFGGPAEVVYWLQLKLVFDHFHVPFPIVMPRNFALIIPGHVHRKWNKTGLSLNDLFLGKQALLKKVVKLNSMHDLHLNGHKEEMTSLFNSIKNKVLKIDPTLGPHVDAQKTKSQNVLETIEKKLLRAEKRHQGDLLRQVESVMDYLFPNGSPQERTENFLNFYLSNPKLIEQLISYFEPFTFRFNILIDG